MPVEALLLVRDPDALRMLSKVLDANGISLQNCALASDALDCLVRHKYDAVIVDCDDLPDGSEVLRGLRAGRANCKAIAFALTNGATTIRAAYELGANFVLEKPLSMERLQRSMRAAHGLIMRERRRYFRHELESSGTVITEHNREFSVRITNISEGGMSFVCADHASLVGAVRFRFSLPECSVPIEGRGEIAWANKLELVGMRFSYFSARSKPHIDEWLMGRAEQMEREMLPASVSRR